VPLGQREVPGSPTRGGLESHTLLLLSPGSAEVAGQNLARNRTRTQRIPILQMISREWKCDRCDFSFSGAGEDSALMSGRTTSIYCADCGSVYDVLTAPYGVPSGKPPKCPEQSRHSVRTWTVEDPCPACGEGTVSDDPDGPIVLMD
jgi:hypothetical protein